MLSVAVLVSVTATITVDGTPISIIVDGDVAQTFTLLINEINADLGAAATMIIDAGDLKVTSSTTGITSTVSIADGTLFSAVTGFIGFTSGVVGVGAAANLFEAFDVEKIPGLSQTFLQTYGALIKKIELKPTVPAGGQYLDSDATYWNGTSWVRLIDDTAI